MLLRMLWRNAFRHGLRTSLTLCGMAVAILAFGLLRTMVETWYSGVAAASATRLVTRNAISLVFPLPLSYTQRIRLVDGVATVSWGNWFGAYYQEPRNFFANFAVDPVTYLDLYPEFVLDPEEKAQFLRDRRGAVAGGKLADRFGWRVGEVVTLKGTIFPGDWEMVLRAIYRGRDKNIDENQFFFHWDYLNETMKERSPRRADQVGFFMIGITDPDRAAEVSATIDESFKNSMAETLTETEKAFQLGFVSMSEAIIMAIRLVSLVIIAIIMAVVANTMAMSVRERYREYAVLKTLGFSGSRIGLLIFGEALCLSLVGGGLGIAATFPAARIMTDLLGEFFPFFHVSLRTVIFDGLAATVVGLVAAVFPAWRAARVPIVEALRRVG